MNGILPLATIFLFASATAKAPAGPWDAFNFAPSTRSFVPRSVYTTVGLVTGAENLLSNSSSTEGAIVTGIGSYIVLDFGQEVSTLNT